MSTIETLALNPMQPYIDHIRSMGVKGRVTLWCTANDTNNLHARMNWTAFIGPQNMQFSTNATFEELAERIKIDYLERAIDPIALGM